MREEPDPKRGLHGVLNELIERTNSIIMRLRIVEQRNDATVVKIDSLYSTAMEQLNESKKTVRNIETRMRLYEDRMIQMESVIKDMTSRISKSITKAEFKGLEDQLKLYDPIKSQFVTKKEIKEMLNEKKTKTKEKNK